MSRCMKCGAQLNSYDIGLYQKMVCRGAEHFLCLPCLAEKFGVPMETLFEKIRQFQEDGCSLLPPVSSPPPEIFYRRSAE